ncbi:hypothetical protein PK98_11280 [Croceibacterium mercuriale]|uniref:Uncharacterized protein n=1 Tax=Croceibacterium mercuriale TaxID=1572751 RepID=A0A0B2BX38_9SPHN|nr:hypothetical protein PK98_11280 [Croceibacterium mercuriale]
MPRTLSPTRLLALLLLAAPVSVQAQDGAAPPLTAEQALATAAARYTTRPPRPEPCPESSGDVIVVCRQLEEWTGGMGLSPTAQAIANGTMPPDPIPQAPDFAGPSTNVAARGCFIPPCPGEPALLIDLKAIPEAPPGSDAARYAGN